MGLDLTYGEMTGKRGSFMPYMKEDDQGLVIDIQIPQGVEAGDKLRVVLPGGDGRIVKCQVPRGKSAGDFMCVRKHESW